MSSPIAKALAFVRQGEGDLSQYRAAKKERGLKMAAGKPPVNLKAFRAAVAASESSTPVGPGCVPAANGAGTAAPYPPPATPPARTCFGCGAACTSHDFCHTCDEHFCVHCDKLPAPPRNHFPEDHLKSP